MSGSWIELLKDADGRSERVIVLSIDVREFTKFCEKRGESVDIALYIKNIYLKILTEYFDNVTFSKPMGDGLFIIILYTEANLIQLMNNIIEKSISLVENFPKLCEEVVMINFPVPEKVGIGVTHGSACCIHNGDDIIDYSGKTLNLAARLMDIARPHGVVSDYYSLIKLLKPESLELFDEDEVFLRGVAEEKKIKVLYLKNSVIISEDSKKPFKDLIWDEVESIYDVKRIKKIDRSFDIKFRKKPVVLDKINLEVSYPKYIDGNRLEGLIASWYYDYDHKLIKYVERGNNYYMSLNLSSIKLDMEKNEVPDEENVTFILKYPI